MPFVSTGLFFFCRRDLGRFIFGAVGAMGPPPLFVNLKRSGKNRPKIGRMTMRQALITPRADSTIVRVVGRLFL